ncbi:MAG: excisionase family DNA-binding protein [Actinomycetota bacterium]
MSASSTHDTPRLVDIDGAADYLTVSPRLVRAMVAERRIPYLKVGKFVRFDLDDLDGWLDQQRVAAEVA